MLGLIFFEFKQFVRDKYGSEMWLKILEQAHLPQESYDNYTVYPDQHLMALLSKLAENTNQTIPKIEEDFGFFFAAFGLRVSKHMINPNWGFIEVLLHTQCVIHERLAKSIKTSTTPFLEIKQVAFNQVLINYNSPRQMCYLGKGIILGIAAHYQVKVNIHDIKCMHKGDPKCVLRVIIR